MEKPTIEELLARARLLDNATVPPDVVPYTGDELLPYLPFKVPPPLCMDPDCRECGRD